MSDLCANVRLRPTRISLLLRPTDLASICKFHKASIAKLTRLKSMKGESFLYTYDFGDNWEHRIDVLDIFEAEAGARLPRFIEGEYRTPPEDVGGPQGFEMILEAISDPLHEEHDQMCNWYGRKFDPGNIDRQTARLWFGSLAKARPAKTNQGRSGRTLTPEGRLKGMRG